MKSLGMDGTILEVIMEKRYETPEAARAKFEEIFEMYERKRGATRDGEDKFRFDIVPCEHQANFWISGCRVGWFITSSVWITTLKTCERLFKFAQKAAEALK